MKTKIICEIGSNFESLDDIKHSIEFAHKVGALPKLQLWKVENVVNKRYAPKMYDVMKKYEIKRDWVKDLGNSVFYSVFDTDSLNFLEYELNPKLYKIASGDATNEKLVKAVTGTEKEVIISFGGCTNTEIRRTTSWVHDIKNVTYMECNSEYPAKCAYLGNLRDRIIGSRLIPWGYSSHVIDNYVDVAVSAVALGAVALEFHFSFKYFKSPDFGHSLNPKQFSELVEAVRRVEPHLTSLEHPFPGEVGSINLGRRGKDGKRPLKRG